MKLIPPAGISPVIHYANVVTVGREANTVWRGRRFIDYQMQLILSGNMRVILPETKEDFIAETGDVFTISPGELNTQILLSPPKESGYACVHFLVDSSPEARAERAPERLVKGLDLELFTNLFQRLDEAFRSPGQYGTVLASGLAKEIFLRLLEAKSATPDGRRQRAREMAHFLDKSFLKRPGRNELAKRFNLAPEYVNQFFRRNFGMSPGEYVRRKLSREACRILLREGISVKECAERLGFKNQFHFTKVFRKEYGIPPSKLQAKVK